MEDNPGLILDLEAKWLTLNLLKARPFSVGTVLEKARRSCPKQTQELS